MATLKIESRGKVEVYYEEEGAGEPLVMVGGLTATVEVWGKLRPLLAAQAPPRHAGQPGDGQNEGVCG